MLSATIRRRAVANLITAAVIGVQASANVGGATVEPPLSIGDPAPPLAIAHWMKGTEVSDFTPGRVYILEFWATWCGPCIANMDHLSEVQDEFRDRDVTVIGLSDEPLQTTVKFLFGRFGPDQVLQDDRTRYSLATDPDRSVHRDYMEAAGLSGIPAVFIIGKQGRVEWIGHPAKMDPALRALVEDTWDRTEVAERQAADRAAGLEMKTIADRLNKAIDEEAWEEAITAIDQLVAMGRETYAPTKLGILLARLKDADRAYAYAKELVETAWQDNPWLLQSVATTVTDGISTGGGTRHYEVDAGLRDPELALNAMQRANELTEWKQYDLLDHQAKLEFQIGRIKAAVEHQGMAVVQLRAIEDNIWPQEMERYRANVAQLENVLHEYQKALQGGAG